MDRKNFMLLIDFSYVLSKVDSTIFLNYLLEPVIIIILGIIVGGLIIGMYLPIFRLGMVM